MFNKIFFFSNLQFHKCTVYTTDGKDLPKGPPPSSGDLGKCRMGNNIFLFFHNAIIPQKRHASECNLQSVLSLRS